MEENRSNSRRSKVRGVRPNGSATRRSCGVPSFKESPIIFRTISRNGISAGPTLPGSLKISWTTRYRPSSGSGIDRVTVPNSTRPISDNEQTILDSGPSIKSDLKTHYSLNRCFHRNFLDNKRQIIDSFCHSPALIRLLCRVLTVFAPRLQNTACESPVNFWLMQKVRSHCGSLITDCNVNCQTLADIGNFRIIYKWSTRQKQKVKTALIEIARVAPNVALYTVPAPKIAL